MSVDVCSVAHPRVAGQVLGVEGAAFCREQQAGQAWRGKGSTEGLLVPAGQSIPAPGWGAPA